MLKAIQGNEDVPRVVGGGRHGIWLTCPTLGHGHLDIGHSLCARFLPQCKKVHIRLIREWSALDGSVTCPGSISASPCWDQSNIHLSPLRINTKWTGGHFWCVQSLFSSLSASHVHLLCQESSSLSALFVANHRQHFEFQHPAQGHLDTLPVSLDVSTTRVLAVSQK